MANKTRQHHYIPQFYLRRFLPGGGGKQLTVLDRKECHSFVTITRNVGGQRDFNRIAVEGWDPNEIEKELSKFEAKVAEELQNLEATKDLSNKKTYDTMMNFMALLAMHNPSVRANIANFMNKINEAMSNELVSSNEKWEEVCEKVEAEGINESQNISYEKRKDFVKNREDTFGVSKTSLNQLEFFGVDQVLPLLSRRSWTLYISNDETGPFITCDKPVSCTWTDPGNVHPIMRNFGGFGTLDTQVLFPVTKNIALIGSFEGKHQVCEATRDDVARINRRVIDMSMDQVYAPDLSFCYLDDDLKIKDGNSIIEQWKK
jgi:Protein of unknown function (DUF4238)